MRRTSRLSLVVVAVLLGLPGAEAHATAGRLAVHVDAGGTLFVEASGPATQIVAVRRSLLAIEVLTNDSDVVAGAGCSSIDGRGAACDQTAKRLNYLGGAEADVVDLSELDIPAFVDAGAGDDVLIGAQAPNTFAGGPGDDTLYGGATTDRLDAGGGSDLVTAGPGGDTVVGGGGDDLLDVSAGRKTVLAGVRAGNTVITRPPPVQRVDGGSASQAGANAAVVIAGQATAVLVRFRAHARRRHKVRVCIHTRSFTGRVFRPYTATVWPNRRDYVRAPAPAPAAWYAHATGNRCRGR